MSRKAATRHDFPSPRMGERLLVLNECANLVNKKEKLCLNGKLCLIFRKKPASCLYFYSAVKKPGMTRA